MAVSERTRMLQMLTFCLIVLYARNSCAKIVEGTLSTKQNWVFLTRFCFKKSIGDIGQLKYHFDYPKEYATQNVILYHDNQWPNVYPQEGMKCVDREDKVNRGSNQIINLTTNYIWSGCQEQEVLGSIHLICNGNRNFRSSRDRWWYIALSNCKSTKGLQAKYRLETTNGDTADERCAASITVPFSGLLLILLTIWHNLM